MEQEPGGGGVRAPPSSGWVHQSSPRQGRPHGAAQLCRAAKDSAAAPTRPACHTQHTLGPHPPGCQDSSFQTTLGFQKHPGRPPEPYFTITTAKKPTRKARTFPEVLADPATGPDVAAVVTPGCVEGLRPGLPSPLVMLVTRCQSERPSGPQLHSGTLGETVMPSLAEVPKDECSDMHGTPHPAPPHPGGKKNVAHKMSDPDDLCAGAGHRTGFMTRGA